MNTTDQNAKYVVWNHNTLCHRQQGSQWLGVLAGNIHGRDWRYGPLLPMQGDDLRPATPEDFEQFRVMLPTDFSQYNATAGANA